MEGGEDAEDLHERDTDDLPSPPVPLGRVERELARGLRQGRKYFDKQGQPLESVDAIIDVLKKTGVVYGPPGPGRPVSMPPDVGDDADLTAVVGMPEVTEA